jgi:hypothetical protein
MTHTKELNAVRESITNYYEELLNEERKKNGEAFRKIYEQQSIDVTSIRKSVYDEYLNERTAMLSNFDSMYKSVVDTIREEYEKVLQLKDEEICRLKGVGVSGASPSCELERENERLRSELDKR